MNKNLLRIDASARTTSSVSRTLADAVQHAWQTANPNGRVVLRDLVAQPIPHISQDTITGYYTPADQLTPELQAATALSDELIAELLAADTLLISTPMYNFSIPSALKAYIDQIVRLNHTFAADENGLRGLVADRPTFIASAAGAVYTGTNIAGLNFEGPYLTTLLGFLGITSVELLSVEGTTMDPQAMEASLQQAQERIHTLLN